MRTKHGDRTSVASPISYLYPVLDTESEFGEVRVATVAVQLARSPLLMIWFARAASLVSSSIDHKLTLDHWLADMKVDFIETMVKCRHVAPLFEYGTIPYAGWPLQSAYA